MVESNEPSHCNNPFISEMREGLSILELAGSTGQARFDERSVVFEAHQEVVVDDVSSHEESDGVLSSFPHEVSISSGGISLCHQRRVASAFAGIYPGSRAAQAHQRINFEAALPAVFGLFGYSILLTKIISFKILKSSTISYSEFSLLPSEKSPIEATSSIFFIFFPIASLVVS